MKKEWSKEEIDMLKNNIDKKYEDISLLLNRSIYSIRGKIRKIKNFSENKLHYDEIDWNEVQKFYDSGNMWDSVIEKFNINNNILNKAVKNKKFKTRSISESLKIHNKENPKRLSNETRNKISEARKKYLQEHPEKVPYLLNHYSKGPSYPENYFNDIFDGKFEYERYYQVGLYQIDFAIVNKGIAIEVDGDQHYLDPKVIESDKRKTEYLKNNYWEIIRIKWSDYQRLNRKEKEEYIKNLISYINDLIIIPHIKKEKLNFCKCGKQIWKTSKMCRECASIEIKSKTQKTNYCKCGKQILKSSKMCNSCTKLNQKRKVENRPEIEELIKMVKETSLEAVGRKYGVTGNAVKKWLKSQKDFNLGKTS